MKVNQGKVHKFSGMTLDFMTPGEVKITMLDCVKELLSTFQQVEPKTQGTKTSATPQDSFKVDEDSKKLSKSKAAACHDLTAGMLHATRHARLDTCMAVAFLTVRVRER